MKYSGFFIIIILLSIIPFNIYCQGIYWENPRELVGTGTRFIQADSSGGIIALVWQENVYKRSGGGEAYLNIWTSHDGTSWNKNDKFAGPYNFIDKEAKLFSLSMDNEGGIYIAVSTSEKETTLFYSEDEGVTFINVDIIARQAIVSPHIFHNNKGNFYLFVTYEDIEEDTLSLYYLFLDKKIFNKKRYKADFKKFITETELGYNFLPSYCNYKDKDYVLFQARITGETSGYQIYLKISDNDGNSWTTAKQLTSFKEKTGNRDVGPEEFENQRPFLTSIQNVLYIVWERKYHVQAPQIYYAELHDSGDIKNWEKVTDTNYSCMQPQLFYYNEKKYLIWFDNPGRNHIKIAERGLYRWEETDLTSSLDGDSRFPHPVQLKGFLYIFWENRYKQTSRLFFLEPDQTVKRPRVYASNFNPDRKSSKSKVDISWNVPDDSSGISSFRYTWSKSEVVNQINMNEVSKDTTKISLKADTDGIWYFKIQAGDFAGNWSELSRITFTKDTIPPEQVVFIDPQKDDKGFLSSNTFKVSWEPETYDDIAGYSYSFKRLSYNLNLDLLSIKDFSIPVPGESIQLFYTEKSYYNIDNGIYAFSVRAIDKAGNTGEKTSLLLKLNKYIHVTKVSYIDSRANEEGETILKIVGRGFSSEGNISDIFIDKDGIKPFDYSFHLKDKNYNIASDRTIDALKLIDIDEGVYRVILNHSNRGFFTSPYQVKLEPSLTVKIGSFPPPFVPAWEKFKRPFFSVNMNEVILWFLLLFMGVVFVASFRKLAGVVREGQIIHAEVIAVMTGEEHIDKKEKKIKQLKSKGLGLRVKFSLLITVLILLVILMLSSILSYYFVKEQQKNLAEGLEQQVRVLLGSLTSGAEKSLPLQNILELSALPDQSTAMVDAESATITGIKRRNSNVPTKNEYVWATNDSEIDTKINTEEYQVGISILEDDVTEKLEKLQNDINKISLDKVSVLADEIKTIIEEAGQYFGRTDSRSVQKLAEIDAARKIKESIIYKELDQISTEFEGSVPVFSVVNLKPSYIFYKPILYRIGDEDIYFRGLVRVNVSTERILGKIEGSRNALIYLVLIISLFAIGLGFIGSIILASITISPIKKIVRGIAKIRDTEDKAELKDHVIKIKQKDELRILADNINQMTQGLVKAAVANKDLIVGKEVQKMFIPLEKDKSGKKGSTGCLKNEFIEIFGYYEGAKGVSGDYFDFIKLDNDHYAVIKCDVAGKGVPAALIMVEVATIFTDYFKSWNPDKPIIKTDQLVYKINDLIEERGFKGRFAALIIIIINIKTGLSYFCNAGDNLLHIYSAEKGKMIQKKLPQAPAAGVFPSMLIEMKSGFKQVIYRLNKGDTLYLFSDGFDEAKRLFRNGKFMPITCDEPSLNEGDVHMETHKKGEEGEELGIKRLYDIINSIKLKTTYKLVKYHNPVPDEELNFDFSDSTSTVEDTIMALVSVEKIFRLYKNPAATETNKILIDKKIDNFLQDHFRQYGEYFTGRLELPNDPLYNAVTHIEEDEQYDDLTILGIRKM